jgi:hypothetical protein
MHSVVKIQNSLLVHKTINTCHFKLNVPFTQNCSEQAAYVLLKEDAIECKETWSYSSLHS